MHKLPFIRICLAIGTGIVFHEFFSLPQGLVVALLAVSLLGCLSFSYLLSKEKTILYNQWMGLSIIMCLFFGSYLYVTSTTRVFPNFPSDKEVFVKAKLNGFPQEREKTFRVEAEVLRYAEDDVQKNNEGKILLYFSKDVDCKSWETGDEIIFKSRLNEIEAAKNPGEFDLKKYNERKGIYYRAYINNDDLIDHQVATNFNINRWFFKARKYLMTLSEKRFNSPVDKALADALIFGYQDDLDEETVTQFSTSGTSHVLAVSGLHVGILWLVLDKILFFLDRKKSQRVFKFFLCLTILWAYAFLTGLSPSVMRSAIMFSGFAFAGLMNEKYSSLNILFVSATIQMLIDPMVIFNIGFQLSYSAVASIVIFYKPIKNQLYLKKKIFQLIWESIALTLSAQILTTPISLYWFGQFPVYFLFSNLILVPLSSLALIEGLAAYALIWLPYVNDLLFSLFIISIKLMDTIAAIFATLPAALLYFNVDIIDVILLYLTVCTISLFLYKKNVYWFKVSIIVICALLSNNVLNELLFPQTHKLIVYNLKRGTVLRHYIGHKVYEYRNPDVDKKSYSYSVKPSDRLFNVESLTNISDRQGFLSMANKNILILRKQHLSKEISQPVMCDWIVVESMKYIDFDKLQHNFEFERLIISNGNSKKSKSYWKKECEKRGIAYYDLAENGALIAETELSN